MGAIRRRKRPAIIRYYLDKSNEYEYARALLLLFVPFRDEFKEISQQNVLKIYKDIKEDPERSEFLQNQLAFYQPYQTLLESMNDVLNDDDEDLEEEITDKGGEFEKFEETTSEADIEQFLRDFNKETVECTDLMEKEELLKLVRSLNHEQRKILDDLVERLKNTDIKKDPVYLYVSGDAGNLSKLFLFGI